MSRSKHKKWRSQRPRERTRVQASAGFRLALACPVEIAAQAAGEQAGPRTIRIVAYTGEAMRLCWWDDPVVIDLATLDLAAQRIPVLYDHTSYVDCVLGQTNRVAIEAGQIVATGALTIPPPVEGEQPSAAERVIRLSQAGFVWQASIGGHAGSRDFIAEGSSVNVNGREYAGPVYVARNVRLQEISFVVNGADPNTSALVARRLRAGTMPTFEDWVMSLGFTVEELTDQQRAALQVAYNDLYGDTSTADDSQPAPAPGADQAAAQQAATTPTAATARRQPGNLQAATTPDVARQLREQAAAEMARQEAVRQILARYPADLQVEFTVQGQQPRRVPLLQHAIGEGLSPDQTELAAIRAHRPQGGQFGIVVRDHDRDCTLQALQGAMILRAGGRLDHPAYQSFEAGAVQADGRPLIPNWLRAGINTEIRQRAMDSAHRYAELSAVDLAAECLRLDGREVPHGRSNVIRAAVSSMSLASVFTTNINAILLPTYLDAPDTTEGWTREVDVADFRLQERPRLLKGVGLTKLPPGGEADHATRQDSGESYRIARYANQIVIDEQNFIDDALGAFADTPVEMGQAAARLRPDLVYAILLANPTLATTGRALFNATDGNTATGATFAMAALRAAITAMMAVRENAVNLNLVATHLIVPVDLFLLAGESVSSAELVIAGTAGTVTERGFRNVVSDMNLKVVGDGRLTNGVVDPDSGTTYAGSTTTWYLACNAVQTIEVGYLRGTGRAPRVRSWTYDRDGKFGMGWDVTLDIGAKALDWKGFQRRSP